MKLIECCLLLLQKPCVSLTDEEYERLFNAVLRQQSDNAIDVSTEKNNADPRADHSKDMFEFSQSDLDDSKVILKAT